MLVCVITLALPFALLWGTRKISYIISKDKLYFFNSQVSCSRKENRKKLRRDRTNGSVCYSDIKDFHYFGIELEGHPIKKFIVPPRFVIIGDDFEVVIYANKSLVEKLKKQIELSVEDRGA